MAAGYEQVLRDADIAVTEANALGLAIERHIVQHGCTVRAPN